MNIDLLPQEISSRAQTVRTGSYPRSTRPTLSRCSIAGLGVAGRGAARRGVARPGAARQGRAVMANRVTYSPSPFLTSSSPRPGSDHNLTTLSSVQILLVQLRFTGFLTALVRSQSAAVLAPARMTQLVNRS